MAATFFLSRLKRCLAKRDGSIYASKIPAVIEKILTHLQEKLTSAPEGLRPESRAPPANLFG